jgi:hypothetical protein
LAANGSNPGGFDSGLQVAKQFTINVTDDSKRKWSLCFIFSLLIVISSNLVPLQAGEVSVPAESTGHISHTCSHQLGHCGMGMVGSINAPTTGNTYESFLAAAQAIGSSEVTVSRPCRDDMHIG